MSQKNWKKNEEYRVEKIVCMYVCKYICDFEMKSLSKNLRSLTQSTRKKIRVKHLNINFTNKDSKVSNYMWKFVPLHQS